jgi:hypothetical protein
MRAMLAGRLDEAEEAVERALDLGEAAHDPYAETIWWPRSHAVLTSSPA